MGVFSLLRKKRNILLGGCTSIFFVVNLFWNDDNVLKVDHGRNLASVDEIRSLKFIEDSPLIFTFYEPIPINERNNGMNDEEDKAMLKAWRESWEAAGWNTKVLSLDDAKRHPQYEDLLEKLQVDFENTKQAEYDNLSLLRWLAVATAGGGWMSDYDVFPLTLTGEVGKILPNDGTFTAYDGPGPALLSGTREEWDRMAYEVINAASGTEDRITDMMALVIIAQNNPDVPFFREHGILREVAYSTTNRVECSKTKDKIAVHFSERRLNEAWEKETIPRRSDIHGTPEERPHYSKKFISDWSLQCGTRLPVIHTYNMPGGPDGMLLPAQNEALLNLWTKIWGQFGWQVKVLTEDDAKKHPQFFKLNEQLEKIPTPELRSPFYRFLAMANLENGGWYSDYDTFPLFMGGDDVNLPNKGNFTIYDGYIPSLMSAQNEGWNLITNALITTLGKMDVKDDFDVVHILQSLRKNNLAGAFVSNNQVYRIGREFQESEKFDCKSYMKRRAAHFKFSFLPADILYAAPLLYEEWEDICVEKSDDRKLHQSTSQGEKSLAALFVH